MVRSKVSIEGVSKVFITKGGRTVEALRNVSFEVFDREFLCVIGPSGCGKTTLLRIIAALERPTSGRVLIDGIPVKPGVAGIIFQEFSLFPWRTTLENVKFGLEVRGVDDEEAERTALRHLEVVGLLGFERAYPHELSEGMKQRVAIARALAVDPPVLLMDEPFAFLDAQTRNLMQAELLRTWEKAKKTVIFVTHSVDEAVFLADRIVVLTARPGRVKRIYEVNLERPRKRTSKPFMEIREGILSLLEEEVIIAKS